MMKSATDVSIFTTMKLRQELGTQNLLGVYLGVSLFL
jgi:hypothetical protein